MKQDVAFHDKNRTGELISRLSTDTIIVSRSLTSNISDGLRALAMSCIGVGAMVYINLELTVYLIMQMTMMMIVPPISIGAVAYGRYLRKISRLTTDASAELTKFSEEKLSNLRTVRAFAQEEREIGVYERQAQHVMAFGMKEAYASGVFFGAAGFSGNMVILALLYYGGSMVQSGAITVGELTSFFLYTAYVGTSLMGLSSWYAELNKGVGASARLFNLLDEKPTIERNEGRQLTVKGKISFENVSFSYPTRPEIGIFSNLSFTLQPGKSVAIVGHSGSGKSTIAQLVMRFYDPQEGAVYIDDQDVRTLDPKWLRENVIAFVSQEPTLFAASIRDNIRYGKPDATDAQVIEAAKIANAHEFIIDFPDGYDTQAGQRIAIARAILRNPQILILDEATSALDAQSEYLVGEALDKIIKGRTTITIAHRLSTIQKADSIVVVSDGRVVEMGTFDELMQKNGVFHELISKQLH